MKKSSRITFVDTEASSSETELHEDEDFSLRDEFLSEWPMLTISGPLKLMLFLVKWNWMQEHLLL